jgi:hypothetical protein
VQLNVGQTMWFATTAARVPVKLEAGGAVLELAQVSHHLPGVKVEYRDPTFGFSFSAPVSWMITRREDRDDPNRASLMVVDDLGLGICGIKVEKLERFDEATRASVRAFAEHQAGQGRKYMKRLEIRPDSWAETTVAGRPAVTFIADTEQGMGPQVTRGVYAFVDGYTVDMWCSAAAENFDDLSAKFTAVIATFRGP